MIMLSNIIPVISHTRVMPKKFNNYYKWGLVCFGLLLLILALTPSASAQDVTPKCGGHQQVRCEFSPATYVRLPVKKRCKSGFFDPRNGGECYSCPAGTLRTVFSVKSPEACQKKGNILGGYSSATYIRKAAKLGCTSSTTFRDPRNGGECWSCPANHNRSIHPVTGSKACTVKASMTCDAGMEYNLFQKKCLRSKKETLRLDAMSRIATMGDDLIGSLEKALVKSKDDDFKSGVKSQSASSTSYAEKEASKTFEPCPVKNTEGVSFKSWTVSVPGDVKLGLGAGVEGGIAVDISQPLGSGLERPVYAFGGAEYSFQLAAGGSAGLNWGCWRADNNKLGGDYHGVVIDLVSAAQGALAAVKKNAAGFKPGKSVGIPIAFWYDVHGHKKNGGLIDTKRDYLGFTIGLSGGYGVDITGVSYVRGTTGQVTGVFPPPLTIFGDKTFQPLYVFKDNRNTTNEFIMRGPNLVQVRRVNSDGSVGSSSYYERKMFGDKNVFKVQKGPATYTIKENGDLLWKSNDSRGLTMTLVIP